MSLRRLSAASVLVALLAVFVPGTTHVAPSTAPAVLATGGDTPDDTHW